MSHGPVICRRCGLRIPDDGECEEAHETFGFALEYAEELPESEREDFLRFHERLVEKHKARLCHCPDHPWTLFSSTPQPAGLDWHDKHDR